MNLQTDPHYHATTKPSRDSHAMLISSTSSREPRGVSPDERVSSSIHIKPRPSSKTIPIVGTTSMHRSPSELALEESERIAEERDYCMYTRIVNGMSASSKGSFQDSWQSNDSLANIIRTRHLPISEDAHFEQLQERYQSEPDYHTDSRYSMKESYNNNGIPHSFVVDCREQQDSSALIGSEEGVFDMEL